MPPILERIAHRVLWDGESQRRSGKSLSGYYDSIDLAPSSVATATVGLGMSRPRDKIRALVTEDDRERGRSWIAFGPSAGLVLGVSLGSASIRAAIVDANGWIYNEKRGSTAVDQLAQSPYELFERVRRIADLVIGDALSNPRLLVDGKLPFLGIAVAWPAPLDENKAPHNVLTHSEWRARETGIHQRLARHLQLPSERSHALNDAAAATLAVVFDHTRTDRYRTQRRPELAIVVRVSGGIGASAMGIEPLSDNVSGWISSRLIGGARELAGELGHTEVNPATLADLANAHPDGAMLKPVRCSCARNDEMPQHVQAYAAAPALAARFAVEGDAATPPQIIRRVLASPTDGAHDLALRETGTLLADALVPSILMLNPSLVTLTGRLATNAVQEAVEMHLEHTSSIEHLFGTLPRFETLAPEESDFIAVRGAALAVFRRHVHRRLNFFYGGTKASLPRRFADLTMPVEAPPWTSARPRSW